MIKFSVARLDKEQIELSGSEPPEFLDLADGDLYEVISDIEYDFLVKKVSGGALLSGSCRVVVASECGRCLEPVEIEIEADDIEMFFDLAECGDEVDISEDIRSELLLELPMILLCDEDCQGLCHECGVNLNQGSCRCRPGAGGSLAWGELDKLDLNESGEN